MKSHRRNGAIAGVLVAAALLAGCGGGGAQSTTTQTFSAGAVLIDQFIGILTIETGASAGSIEVEVTATEAQFEILPMTVEDGTLTNLWEGEPDRPRGFIEFWRGRWTVSLDELESYPHLTIRLPADAAIEMRNLFARFDIADRTGLLDIELDRGVGSVGTTARTIISVVGDGTVELGPVTQELIVSISGSGDVSIDSAAMADFTIAGSGSVDVGDVEDVNAAISGSGDVAVGNAGKADLTVNGSGNIRLGEVGDFTSQTAGSGDISAAAVNGSFSATVSGSSNIVVEAGRAAPFQLSVAGSGGVRFDGTAVDPQVSVSGSGDVFLGNVEGDLDSSISGSGDVTVGE